MSVLTTAPFSARQRRLVDAPLLRGGLTSMSRAVAPALRSGSQEVRMLMLPTMPCSGPNSGSTGAKFGADLFQSHSSSSASSWKAR